MNRAHNAMPATSLVQALPYDAEADLPALISQVEARFAESQPQLDAFLPEPGRFERLRRDAEELLKRFPVPAARPPLFGALLGVKDIFHVDGFLTRAGADLPPELFAGPEADMVTRLKAAGALIIGKTVTTEFAYFEPGPTRNPHNPAHTPGGSSSGSAAAIAAGLAHIATGTQTVGSVIRPAAYCGVIGYKPSFGRASTRGLVAFSPSADHVGLFTPDMATLQRSAPVIVDGWQPFSAIEPPRLAVPHGAYLRQARALPAFERQLERLEQAGYHIKGVELFDDIDAIDACHLDLIAAELAWQHRHCFAQYSQRYRPRTAALIRQGQRVSAKRLAECRRHRGQLRARLHKSMTEAGVDLWLCPAAQDVAPRGLAVTGSPVMNMPWTHAGLPALSLPAGPGALGLPLGMQLVARFGADEPLLAWARKIEPALRRWPGD